MFHFHTPWKRLKPKVFWRFHGVWKCSTGIKWVKVNFFVMVKSIGSSLLISDSNFFGTIINSVKKTLRVALVSLHTYTICFSYIPDYICGDGDSTEPEIKEFYLQKVCGFILKYVKNEIIKVKIVMLIHFTPIFHYYSSWEHQEPRGTLGWNGLL